MNIPTRLSAILLAATCSGTWVRAADLYHYDVSELKAPDCVQDASNAFFSQNDQRTEPIRPVLAVSNFYLLVRYVYVSAPGISGEFKRTRAANLDVGLGPAIPWDWTTKIPEPL